MFHQRLAMIAFGAGHELGLVLAGGYAASAHHSTDRAGAENPVRTGQAA